MKKTGLLLIALLCVWKLDAQTLSPEVMSCFGGDAKNSNFQVVWTGGEPFYTTISSSDAQLTQGFNQTLTVELFTDVETLPDGFSFVVFPNPTQEVLNVTLTSENQTALYLQLIDLNGKVFLSKQATQSKEQLDVASLAKGIYLLNISDNKQVIRTFKVIKN